MVLRGLSVECGTWWDWTVRRAGGGVQRDRGVGRGRAGRGGVGLGGGPNCGIGAASKAERSRGSAANSPNILADALGWPTA